jgi:hypothetical protein
MFNRGGFDEDADPSSDTGQCMRTPASSTCPTGTFCCLYCNEKLEQRAEAATRVLPMCCDGCELDLVYQGFVMVKGQKHICTVPSIEIWTLALRLLHKLARDQNPRDV